MNDRACIGGGGRDIVGCHVKFRANVRCDRWNDPINGLRRRYLQADDIACTKLKAHLLRLAWFRRLRHIRFHPREHMAGNLLDSHPN